MFFSTSFARSSRPAVALAVRVSRSPFWPKLLESALKNVAYVAITSDAISCAGIFPMSLRRAFASASMPSTLERSILMFSRSPGGRFFPTAIAASSFAM